MGYYEMGAAQRSARLKRIIDKKALNRPLSRPELEFLLAEMNEQVKALQAEVAQLKKGWRGGKVGKLLGLDGNPL